MTAPGSDVQHPGPARGLVPIACTLTDDKATERIDEWRVALQEVVISADRPSAGRLRLVLADNPTRIGALVTLAQAEKACCPFFDFTVTISADAISLVVDVPEGSEVVLDDFARLTNN